MSEQIISKKCSHCKVLKPISEFNKNRTNRDGYKWQCRICCHNSDKMYRQSDKGKAYTKQYWQSKAGHINRKKALHKYDTSDKGKKLRKEYYVKYPEKFQARNAVNHAVSSGKLPRPDSLQCYYGKHPAQQYHHWYGYKPEYWLNVIPVCRKCHKKP